MLETVLYEVSDAVATITLNRPDAFNSLTGEMKVALRDRLERARSDDHVRAIVLTGAGRAFCAGQDLREHAANLAEGRGLDNTVRDHYNPVIRLLTAMPKPIVAAVNGVAAGAGASLAFACDLRLCAPTASFLMAFARLGLAADSGSSWTLQRLAGLARATELLMLAEPVNAERALADGLVSSVTDDVVGASRDLAVRLAQGPTFAYGAIKRQLAFAATHGLDESLDFEADLQDECAATADHPSATRAFVAKQTPIFEGR